ncbi:MAG: hypothetical protein J0G94_19085 [Sphingomonadales bacterium]|nr:hypothetical protein [Sphingomonadales bacterium]
MSEATALKWLTGGFLAARSMMKTAGFSQDRIALGDGPPELSEGDEVKNQAVLMTAGIFWPGWLGL